MKKSVLDVLLEDRKHNSRPMRTSEYEELEDLMKQHGSFIAITSAYYYGYMMGRKKKVLPN